MINKYILMLMLNIYFNSIFFGDIKLSVRILMKRKFIFTWQVIIKIEDYIFVHIKLQLIIKISITYYKFINIHFQVSELYKFHSIVHLSIIKRINKYFSWNVISNYHETYRTLKTYYHTIHNEKEWSHIRMNAMTSDQPWMERGILGKIYDTRKQS